MRIRGAHPQVELSLDVPEQFHLVSRIQALRPVASRWDHDPVALFPRSKRGRRDIEHLRHGADAVYGLLSDGCHGYPV